MFNLSNLRIYLLGMIVTTLLSSCAYTTYEFSAPTNIDGKHCVMRCLEIKQKAESNCNWVKESCNNRVSTLNEKDQFSAKADCNIEKSNCSDKNELDYRQCYADCGGTVRSIEHNN